MPTPSSTAITSSDQILFWSTGNGDVRRTTFADLLALLQDQFASPEVYEYGFTPLAGFNVTVPDDTANKIWMQIKPAGTLATGTVTLPAAADTVDGKEVLITSNQIITTFTVALNGASAANGAPTTLAANGFATLRFSVANNSWYRVA